MQHQKEILQLERDVQKGKEMDPTALALLRGIKLRYPIKSTKITLGRNTKDRTVDVNLAEEGPASKASRKQATITLKPNCHFYIKNCGKKPIFVNGKAIESGQSKKIPDGGVLEVRSRSTILMFSDWILAFHIGSKSVFDGKDKGANECAYHKQVGFYLSLLTFQVVQ
jgi:hypothetical protein